MRIGIFHRMLRLFLCISILFPNYVLAGPVSIPGFNGQVAPKPAVSLPGKGGMTITLPGAIPGFYGRTVVAPPTTARPTNEDVINMIGISKVDDDPSKNTTTIHQNDEKAIINWGKFDIGSGATVVFDQQGKSDWAALNRIWDRDPSYIFGTLKADGKIYLINQNGILFGHDSKVNVNSLVASALNIKDEDFIKNVLKFYVEDGSKYPGFTVNPESPQAVSNYGELTSSGGGYIFLMAPRVENAGLISAELGQVGLVAGTKVTLRSPSGNDTPRPGFYVIVDPSDFNNSSQSADPTFGKAVNAAEGVLSANGGMVGMYGATVEHWGIIRSVTAFHNKLGGVELRAANKVTTGADSEIQIQVNPSTTDTVSDTFDIQPYVDIKGLHALNDQGVITDTNPVTRIELQGRIEAPTGNVSLAALNRVYMEAGSLIDVSGVNATLPAQVLEDYKLTSVELRDAYAQKGGIAQGMKITTSVMGGSSIGDLSQAILGRDKTALERSIGGAIRKTPKDDGSGYDFTQQTGNIKIEVADGDIIVKQNATLDFSGGVIRYAGGFADTTKLVSGGKVYDISNAPANLVYDGIANRFEKTNERFGVRETWSGLYYGGGSPLMTYVPAYTKGGDAGMLTLKAATVVLDGKLIGGVQTGTYQTVRTDQLDDAKMLSLASGREAPRAGTLIIGDDQVSDPFKSQTTSISILSDTSPRSELSHDSPLQTGQGQPTVLSARILDDASLDTLKLYALQTISTAPDARISLQPGGAFSASARRIEHQGELKVPAGSITMLIGQNATSYGGIDGASGDPNKYVQLDERIILGPGSRLDASGERIDNSLAGKTGSASLRYGQTKGGGIIIQDKTDLGSGVFIQPGAVVDVSGGYSIDQKGKAAGGNAGTLSIQGANIALDGELRGYALADLNGKIPGGKITLASKELHIFDHTSPVTTPQKDALYLADNLFDDTGFTQFAFKSMGDIVLEPNAQISASLVRLNTPATVQGQAATGSAVPGRPDLIRLYPDVSTALAAGPSSFTATTSKSFEGAQAKQGQQDSFTGNLKTVPENGQEKITISQGAGVRTAPAVASGTTTISLTAPLVEVAGTLESPGGNITVNATNGDLTIKSGAQLLAGGFNRNDPASTPKGFAMNSLPVNGGSVTLSAGRLNAIGDLILEAGTRIDISGAGAVTNTLRSADGSLITFREAGAPGSLSLSSTGELNWAGDVNARAGMEGIRGGALVVSRINASNNDSGMDVRAADLDRYINSGFDDLTLRSLSSLNFNEGLNKILGRKLTLDAPQIQGIIPSGQSVSLSAPWIVLTSSSYNPAFVPQQTPTTQDTQFTLAGRWIDVVGITRLSGFDTVKLDAARDIRVSQALYKNDSVTVFDSKGKLPINELAASGNLVLDADRIYPGNYYQYNVGNDKAVTATIYPDLYSDFTLHADGKVTIQNTHTHVDELVYSAGGSLTVEAGEGIEVGKGGALAAPMGQISLSAPGKRIYLADGSKLITAGDGNKAINYGLIDSRNLWVVADKGFPGVAEATTAKIFDKDSMPQKSITLEADETIMMQGSSLDVSGGGKFFAYKFQPGVEGSVDPLAKPGRYVVFKDNGMQQPGTEVYLKGGGGLGEGRYTLFALDANNPQNARYAFQPGAYILELQSGAPVPGTSQQALSKDGYPLTVGYTSVADTQIRGTRPLVYSVRTAAEVLAQEGSYVKPDPVTSGDGGSITLKGNTTVIEGAFKASPSPYDSTFKGGSIALNGKNVIVQPATPSSLLGENFGFESQLDGGYKNRLTVTADAISGKGFGEIDLGYSNTQNPNDPMTDSVVIKSGSTLKAALVSLTAKGSITVESGATIYADTTKDKDSGEGVISLTTPGSLSVENDATLHAAHKINLNVQDIKGIKGKLEIENSSITLQSSAIYFDDGTLDNATYPGLHLTQKLWETYSSIEDITLKAGSPDANNKYVSTDIQFWIPFSDSSDKRNSITLDAARIVNQGGNNVSLSAPTVNLKNSGAASTAVPDPNSRSAGVFSASANTIDIGGGDVTFANFKSLQLSSKPVPNTDGTISKGDVIFVGKGSLSTGNAALAIDAARVTTAAQTGKASLKDAIGKPITNPDGTAVTTAPITAANFMVYTGANYNVDNNNVLTPAGDITIANSSGKTPDLTSASGGGMLELRAANISHNSGILQSDGGTINLVANGTDGISLGSGAQILARATADSPGGEVSLRADNGNIYLDKSGSIDVSGFVVGKDGTNVGQGDAGKVSLLAPKGYATIDGYLSGISREWKDSQGNKVKGRGGSFVLDSNWIGLSALNDKLMAGGFNESIDIRARTGDLILDTGKTMAARHIKLTADGSSMDKYGNPVGGNINVGGKLDASAYAPYADGGTIELYAMNDLNVNGSILATGMDNGKGGSVRLSSTSGWVNVNADTLDVSGGKEGGEGGEIYLRAKRNYNDVNIVLNNSLKGASAVYAEAVAKYTFSKGNDNNFISGTSLGNTTYVFVNTSNQAMYFTYNGTSYKATFGLSGRSSLTFTDGSTLATAVQNALNNAVASDGSGKTMSGNPFAVGYDKTTGQLTIKNNSTSSDVTDFMTPSSSTLSPSALGLACSSGSPCAIQHSSPGVFDVALRNASNFYNNAGNAIKARLAPAAPGGTSTFHLIPGIEVVSNGDKGDIVIDTPVDLTSYKFGDSGDPDSIALTLRAGGNLMIKGSLVDHPTPLSSLPGSGRSSAFNLVAGADLGSADPLAVIKGQTDQAGNLKIEDNVVVYTESAPIRFASGGDTVIGTSAAPGYMIISPSSMKTSMNSGKFDIQDLHITDNIMKLDSGFMWPENLIQIAYTDEKGPQLYTAKLPGQVYAKSADLAKALEIALNSAQYTKIMNSDSNNYTDYYKIYDGITITGHPFFVDYGVTVPGRLTIKSISTSMNYVSFSFSPDLGSKLGSLTSNPILEVSSSMPYSLASYSGPIQGNTGRDLVLNGVIQTATRDISINVGRDLQRNSGGAIRTTGQASSPGSSDQYWNYTGGGDITLDVGRYVGTLSSGQWVTARDNAWDYFTPLSYKALINSRWKDLTYDLQFSADYTNGTAGFATMGGGDLFIRTGGDFLSQAGTFGNGNLAIYAGGDIRGRFLSKSGNGGLHAQGNFGSADERQQIELFDSKFAVTAAGEIQLGAVLNPSLASDKVASYRTNNNLVNCDYTPDTKISLKAGSDVTIAGRSPHYLNQGSARFPEKVMPATVDVDAGGNIFILNDLTLASSPSGNLSLVARGGGVRAYIGSRTTDVTTTSILVSDIAPAYWYGHFNASGFDVASGSESGWINNRVIDSSKPATAAYFHGYWKPEDAGNPENAKALHNGDPQPIEISAKGNIEDLNLILPKQAEVKAGGDIRDVMYQGQNVNPADISIIKADGDISVKYAKAISGGNTSDQQPHNGFIQGGPGAFIVQAGGSIDLGSMADGIQTIGNGGNFALGSEKSTLVVISGYKFDKKAEDIGAFFQAITDASDKYSSLMQAGKLDEGAELLQKTRTKTISTFLGTATPGAGDITMTSSQIGTSIGQSDIFVIAAGSLNLGKTALPSSDKPSATTGIWTGDGGGINIFAVRDVNVNESRIMTFQGGDISIWSDQGDINAGRGSRTAVNAKPPRKVDIPGGGSTLVYTPPATGSGIRATHPTDKNLAGNVHLYAKGVIDAGEAGIFGKDLHIWAEKGVLNAANIAGIGSVVGVPKTTTGATNLGALSGAGTVATQGSQALSEASGGVAAQRTAQAAKMIEDIMMKWLDVKVIDFVQNDSVAAGDQGYNDTNENKHKGH